MINLIADGVVAFLLVLTSLWCCILVHRLRRLKVERGDVEQFMAAIHTATARAEAAIAGIRDSASDAQLALAKQREALETRMAELARLEEGGAHMARRLETVLHVGARTVADLQTARDRRLAASPPAGPSEGQLPPLGAEVSERGRRSRHEELLRTLEGLR